MSTINEGSITLSGLPPSESPKTEHLPLENVQLVFYIMGQMLHIFATFSVENGT